MTLYGPDEPIPPAPQPTTALLCRVCGNTGKVADDIPCPCTEDRCPAGA